MPIGKSHRSQSDLVRTVLDDVAKASPAEYTEAFRRQISRLDSWTARIAAVGQVKAGKSTFLNALSGQPGLLPSDVNPWTSVITNMRINIDGDPALGARFDFFDDTSWQRIINGEPEMRALAEEMLPEFDADELRRHTEEMRARARRRLGNSYDRLLGAHHTFDTLSPDLVEQYVCVGPPDEDRIEGQAAGRYTAITKVADLYMRSGDFAVPTILTDTPGVNDPFMVRDEFTCQTLNNADIFLIVLSAHQALTEIDISLTRMLAHQGARQVIVFINRMDELDDYAAECAHIVQDVSNRLHEAAPEHGFSIAYGSAWWASLALDATTPAAELRDQADDPELIRFVQEIHGSCPEDPRLRLLLASGLPDVWRGVSDAIEFGSGARILTEIMGATRAQMNALTIVSRRRREALQEQIETYGTGNLEMVLTDLEADVTHLEETGRQMTRLIERTEIELDTALNAGWFELQKTMDDKMHDFLAQRVTAIRDTWEGPDKHSDSHLEIDLLPLRELMEADLRNGYALARRNIDDILGPRA